MVRSTTVSLLLLIGTVTVLLTGCGETGPVEASFVVEGMTCESCSNAIIDTLGKIDGVSSVEADHVAGTAGAVFVPSTVSADVLAGEIEGLGYTVTATTTAPLDR